MARTSVLSSADEESSEILVESPMAPTHFC